MIILFLYNGIAIEVSNRLKDNCFKLDYKEDLIKP